MDLSISSLYANVDGYLKKMSRGKRLALVGVIAFVLVGSVILASVLNSVSFTVLYRGLSPSEGIEVVNLLDSTGINYKLQNDGTILVPKDKEAMLKMQLAAEGFPKSTLGYDMFTSQTDLMTTDYEKKQYLIFQLQDRLQDSLKTLEGVKNAIVTLSVADASSFVLKADKPQSSASVVLDLFTHTDLTKKQIKGIEELVAKSVPGLLNENVVIVNNDGMVLNEHAEDFGTELALSQMETINKINELYKDKIVRFLEPVFGKDGMSVAVSVQMDFKKKTSEQTTYTPVVGDSGIVSKEQFDRQSVNGGTVLDSGAGTESNTGVPTYEEGENGEGQSSASDSGSNEYLINKLIEGVNDYGGQIKDMTVSVMINSSSLSNETVNKYREMVAFGAGIAVDKVIITYEEFLSKPAMAIFQDPQTKPFLGLTTGAFIFIGIGVFILLLVIVILAQRKKDDLEYEELDEEPVKPPQRKRQMPGEIILTETREQGIKRQVKEFASNNPETVAQLLRSWMKEETVK